MVKGIRQELIGAEIKVIGSENRFNIGICGKVIDETKNMLIIRTKTGKNSS